MTPPIPFETYRSSDVDGSAMLVVDGTKMDLTGWTAELRDDSADKVTVTGFESRSAPRLDDAW